MPFEVHTEQFKGPFELLLDLIEQRKLLINEISLAQVTDDFIKYVETNEKFPMHESAQFILVAATLLLIKSRSLLPTLELTKDEESDIKMLEARLAAYSKTRILAAELQKNFDKNRLFAPQTRNFVEKIFAPGRVSQESLVAAIKKVLADIPKIEKLPQVIVQKVISLEEMIEHLATRVQHSLKFSFREFSGGKTEKINVIVSFLAMLELVKRGAIQVEQKESFSDIEIATQDVGVPKYN